MTIDVEEHFQVSAFEPNIPREAWQSHPSRVEANTARLLDLLGVNGVRATFFVLGWVAERAPDLVRRISAAGHEVASHGYDHVRATAQSPERFREDVQRTKSILEDVAGETVRGYRAPSFSFAASNRWVWNELAEAGYEYSSSVYPIRHDHYGLPSASRRPFYAADGALLEIPVSTVRVGTANLPCGGGGYFRLLPYWYSSWALRRLNARDRMCAVFYLHPWELDPGQPRQPGLSLRTRLRHYTNLGRMEARLSRLLGAFRWDRMDAVFLDPAKGAPRTAASR